MLLEALGEVDEAASHAAQSVAIMGRLAAEDPSNVDWQRELGRSHYRAGSIAGARGAFPEALAHLQTAAAVIGRAAASDTLNPARQRDLADARAALAQHFVSVADAPRAVAEAVAAERVAAGLLEKSPDDRQAARLRGLSLMLQGRAWSRAGERVRARSAWSAAASVLEPVARRSRDYDVLGPWALTLIGLERKDEAREVVQTLGAIGYRHPAFLDAVARGGFPLTPPTR
jgi:tetratricopeptide (TPR) repeat protein